MYQYPNVRDIRLVADPEGWKSASHSRVLCDCIRTKTVNPLAGQNERLNVQWRYVGDDGEQKLVRKICEDRHGVQD